MKNAAILIFFIPVILFAQNKPGTELRIKKAKGEIKIDGVLDEEDWLAANLANNWFLNYPVDTALAPFQTEARVTFNDQFLYVSFVCYDDSTPDLVYSLRRDFDYELNDNVGMNIGPYNDRINGFFFVITPKGVQMEGTISGAGVAEDSYNIYWDNKWYSKVIRYEDKWIAELAIPFKSFRYKGDLNEWNIAFDRSNKKRNHKSAWIHTPIQYVTGSYAYSGQLIWEDPVPPPHTNISIIPFVAGSSAADHETEPTTHDTELQAGFDAKVSITPSMNLDMTVNPDFSQVEVDQQVINLTRFEFQFPERRQFFLENSDLFDRAGFPEVKAFFSRRVGLVQDSSGLFKKVPIVYGARLSGSINKNWRLSAMNMGTKEKLSVGLPAQMYSVVTLQRNFWRQSNISLTYVDKESLQVSASDSLKYFHESIFHSSSTGTSSLKPNTYNRVINADLELRSEDNRWYSSSFLANSFDAFNDGETMAGGTNLQYAVRRLNVSVGHTFVQKNYNAEAGFVPSAQVYPGLTNYTANLFYKIYPENSPLVVMGPQATFNQTYIPGGILSDRMYTAGYKFFFLNTSTLLLNYNYIFQRLTSDFNPIDPDRYATFNEGEEYSWQNISGTFQSNTRSIVNFLAQVTYGGFYNGTNLNINGQISYRYQPFGNVSLRYDYNDLRLPGDYGEEKLFLIGPRFDITLTDKFFITTYVQYNNVIDNINLNARIQWRYKPASDFYIVYTENYFPAELTSKNRALVLKLTYWFNI